MRFPIPPRTHCLEGFLCRIVICVKWNFVQFVQGELSICRCNLFQVVFNNVNTLAEYLTEHVLRV